MASHHPRPPQAAPSAPIEDYALVGDLHTAALVSRTGSVDWLCLPRFDSSSLFAALLDDERAGRWSLRPVDETATSRRSYIDDTFVLRTTWQTPDGEAEVLDFMPLGDSRPNLVRRIRGLRGSVEFSERFAVRFDYGAALPWVRQIEYGDRPAILATAGPDSIIRRGPRVRAQGLEHRGEHAVSEGQTIDIVLTWYPSHRRPPKPLDVDAALDLTLDWWREWARRSAPPAPYAQEVRRSLLVLRALTDEDTGGISAAATTSLPETEGGVRNWDYRYVWLRDAALTIAVLLTHGYREEAEEWRGWLLRAIAGDPADVQIMYGIGGERRLPEFELEGLRGHGGARPVRIGNGAYRQRQWDIFGEVMVALHGARVAGLEETAASWPLQRALLAFLADNWQRPDHGIWEIRGDERHFTHSRAMVWAAFDRGARGVREFGLPGDADRWQELADTIRAEILARGFDERRGSFRQHYDTDEVDAALLQLPQIGFLPPDDERMTGTVAAIEEDLMADGLLLRYRTSSGVDGLAGEEHPFLACSFWLVEQYAGSGRLDDAEALMARALEAVNDVGLLAEEYDPVRRRQMGNTPQALSHLALVRAADAIDIARRGRDDLAPHVRGESEGDAEATGTREKEPTPAEARESSGTPLPARDPVE
ncbi:glucoamylase [Microbacterium barkeri]|uniref:Glucoamylase n=1 Tax=Microbacterium barkeri TaxID=33917 RepID=A0A9W6LV03_9MICO|nr:glycoside hydrolase family 15 protein [Microbacterium barkeri]MDR6876042.1 GH15 family glucan-1,4-alpha-glucosidase [Microbacterium barkeri]GLJ60159.1 glucoamylase [Microbacterium barkeri]